MKKIKLFFALFAMLALGVGNAWGETVSNTWDLTSSSSDWTNEGCVTYFSQPYGIKKKGAYIINKNISDFIKYSSTATNIKIGVKSLCNGATSSKLTVSLVDASGNVVGTGLEITPDNATAASKTTYKYVTFTSNFANIAGYKVECTTFGKNVLINGTSYEITYTPSSSGETPGEGGGEEPTPGTGGETWTLVTNASDLKAGDIIVIASNTKGFVASSTITSDYMGQVNSTFSTDKSTITTLPAEAAQLTIGGTSGAWTLTYDGKQLGATAVKKVAWDSGTKTWSITIANDGGATIQNGESTYGRFLHNVNSTRFTTYTSNASTSMLLPQIYKKVTSSGGSTETVVSLLPKFIHFWCSLFSG